MDHLFRSYTAPSHEPIDLSQQGFAAFPLDETIHDLLDRPAPDGWSPSGYDREAYLDLAEPIVNMAVSWVDEQGAVIDPVIESEWGQSSPRFAAAAAVLIRFGRCHEHLDTVCRVMGRCCRLMADLGAKDLSPDFWLRELMTADSCLAGIAPTDVQAAWRADLRRVNPEALYRFVDPEHGEKMRGFHNWAVYSSGGEVLRDMAGLVGPEAGLAGQAFFDCYMEPQFQRFTEHGMYRDPADPITYDITTRLQVAIPIFHGMGGPHAAAYGELLRRGAITSLLYCSADGYVPFGGRSSQFHFQEAMQSAICELEARRHASADPRLAGAFKRQAHLGVTAIRRWILDMDPIRHIKNGFDPATRHGIDKYGQYSVYSLLCGSFLGLAACFADDDIAEAPTPAELGGCLLRLPDAFHKVFASAGGVSLEIDTAADAHYDASGLGRLLFAGRPMEMILAMPVAAEGNYLYAPDCEAQGQATAIGPAWIEDGTEHSLAAIAADCEHSLESVTGKENDFAFTLLYQQGSLRIEERYHLLPMRLHYEYDIQRDAAAAHGRCLRLPLLSSDGSASSELQLNADSLQGSYRGATYRVTWPARLQASWEPEKVCNRNGCYRVLRLQGDAPLTFDIACT